MTSLEQQILNMITSIFPEFHFEKLQYKGNYYTELFFNTDINEHTVVIEHIARRNEVNGSVTERISEVIASVRHNNKVIERTQLTAEQIDFLNEVFIDYAVSLDETDLLQHYVKTNEISSYKPLPANFDLNQYTVVEEVLQFNTFDNSQSVWFDVMGLGYGFGHTDDNKQIAKLTKSLKNLLKSENTVIIEKNDNDKDHIAIHIIDVNTYTQDDFTEYDEESGLSYLFYKEKDNFIYTLRNK